MKTKRKTKTKKRSKPLALVASFASSWTVTTTDGRTLASSRRAVSDIDPAIALAWADAGYRRAGKRVLSSMGWGTAS